MRLRSNVKYSGHNFILAGVDFVHNGEDGHIQYYQRS